MAHRASRIGTGDGSKSRDGLREVASFIRIPHGKDSFWITEGET